MIKLLQRIFARPKQWITSNGYMLEVVREERDTIVRVSSKGGNKLSFNLDNPTLRIEWNGDITTEIIGHCKTQIRGDYTLEVDGNTFIKSHGLLGFNGLVLGLNSSKVAMDKRMNEIVEIHKKPNPPVGSLIKEGESSPRKEKPVDACTCGGRHPHKP